MSHPYTSLPTQAFWRSGVAQTDPKRMPDLFQPKFPLTPETRVSTAGSCFAQHIGRFLREAGCAIQDAEPRPRHMSDTVAARYGYGLYSGRYGNVYTTRQMTQLLEDVATGHVDPHHVWEKDGRFYDAFRPTIEPTGMDTLDEVLLHRAYHLERTADLLRSTDTFVFTLGLTETFVDVETDRAYPMCPGVVAGEFDPKKHEFVNLRASDVLADLYTIRAQLHRFNPQMKLLLTVSPVPLTATAAGGHVLSATTWSKSVLRAAAGEFVADHPDVDYFPSYEIITSHATGGPWFGPNMRSVRDEGVERVMGIFFEATGLLDATEAMPARTADTSDPETLEEDDLVCDELLLQAFSD